MWEFCCLTTQYQGSLYFFSFFYAVFIGCNLSFTVCVALWADLFFFALFVCFQRCYFVWYVYSCVCDMCIGYVTCAFVCCIVTVILLTGKTPFAVWNKSESEMPVFRLNQRFPSTGSAKLHLQSSRPSWHGCSVMHMGKIVFSTHPSVTKRRWTPATGRYRSSVCITWPANLVRTGSWDRNRGIKFGFPHDNIMIQTA
jgi:hypothetical protein